MRAALFWVMSTSRINGGIYLKIYELLRFLEI
jgi:hypothetical protein